MDAYVTECENQIMLADITFSQDYYKEYLLESGDSLLDALKEFIKSIIDAIKSLFERAKDDKLKSQFSSLKKETDNLRKLYNKASSEEKQKILSRKYKIQDIDACLKKLDDYYDKMVQGYLKILNVNKLPKSYVMAKQIDKYQKDLEKGFSELKDPPFMEVGFKEFLDYVENIEPRYNEFMRKSQSISENTYYSIYQLTSRMETLEIKEKSKDKTDPIWLTRKITKLISDQDIRKLKRVRDIFIKCAAGAYAIITAIDFVGVAFKGKDPEKVKTIGGLFGKTFKDSAEDARLTRRALKNNK